MPLICACAAGRGTGVGSGVGSGAGATGAEPPSWMISVPQIGDWLVEQWDLYIGKPGAINAENHMQVL